MKYLSCSILYDLFHESTKALLPLVVTMHSNLSIQNNHYLFAFVHTDEQREQLPCNHCVFPLEIWDDNLILVKGGTTLICAAINGHRDCIRAWIESGADVNKTDRDKNTPLIWASTRNNVACVELLLRNGADVNRTTTDNRTALHVAANNGHVDSLNLLIKAGAGVNARDDEGETPLISAAESLADDNHRCVDSLIKSGADVNATDTKGNSPLAFGVFWSISRIVEVLIQAGADVNASDYDGNPALTIAIGFGNVEMTDMLIQAGADVNRRDRSGETLLMSVDWLMNGLDEDDNDDDIKDICFCQVTLLMKLLRANADINRTDNFGLNALLRRLHLNHETNPKKCNVLMLLYAAGETLQGLTLQRLKTEILEGEEVPECIKETFTDTSLKHLCRQHIRKHLIQQKPHRHLFGVIPQLGLPSLIESYLLYNMSLDIDNE